MINEEDIPLTFSDEAFERRYSPESADSSAKEDAAPPPARPPAAPIGRSRNRFMRTLLRRRMASSAG